MITLNILESLIQIPSVTLAPLSCLKIFHKANNILNSGNIISKDINFANRHILIWGELDLKKTQWLINSHLDVVPGVPSQFVPQIKRGKVWGRGAGDTKSSCAIMLANAHHWNQPAQSKHLTFMLVTDEETGGDSSRELIKNMPNLKGAVFLEPTGEKMIVQAKGIIQLKISAPGKTCHGSRPWDGDNAIEKLAHGLLSFRHFHPSPMHETRVTTFNFSQIEGGTAINQIPPTACLWCDVRWNPSDNPQKIIQDLADRFTDCKIETVKMESPINCAKDSLLLHQFSIALKQNGVNPIRSFEHGSSDARHATALGIPAIVIGPKGKNFHADNEWVSLKSITKIEQIIDTWIKNL